MNTVLPLFEDVKELNEFLKPFPSIDDIFVDNQPWLKDHFLPLISIDLGMLKDEWRGQVLHMLNPFEPFEGYIGECTHEYHNEFTGENWLAFKLTDNNQYEFLGDEGYFERSPIYQNSDVFDEEILEEYNEIIDESMTDYQKSQEFFVKTGKLANIHVSKLDGEIIQKNWLDNLGGDFSKVYGNWVSGEPPKAICKKMQDGEIISINYQGNPIYFIAGVPAYNYGCGGADWIVMLYEPINKIVLFTYDWS